jgi:hypothetical protein
MHAPPHGYAAKREATMAAFARSWRREKRGQLSYLAKSSRKIPLEMARAKSVSQKALISNLKRLAP